LVLLPWCLHVLVHVPASQNHWMSPGCPGTWPRAASATGVLPVVKLRPPIPLCCVAGVKSMLGSYSCCQVYKANPASPDNTKTYAFTWMPPFMPHSSVHHQQTGNIAMAITPLTASFVGSVSSS
jgi:hypothetical protein